MGAAGSRIPHPASRVPEPGSRLQRTSNMKQLIIAIDGPSGAGKGTIARAVAARLGYQHVDTGAMYRALAWKGLQDSYDLTNESGLAALAARLDFDVCDGRVRV